MRVRYLGKHQALQYGCEYVVLSIGARGSGGVDLMVLTDDDGRPGWFPAAGFDLVSDEVPSNWRIRVGGLGDPGWIEVGPAEWMEPGFMEDYWGDGGPATAAAHDVFDRELEVILKES